MNKYVYIKPKKGIIIRNPDKDFQIMPEEYFSAVNRKFGLARVAENGATLKEEEIKKEIVFTDETEEN